ncbi:MAG: YbaB/EbfC family nucleoid-associated protein [Planctomycetaceae bacterium]|nr:YbaB/EbfC family nucleoid-associated protein [Planctomycetaceae bacterium]
MFDQLKNLGSMMQQAKQMQSRMAEVKEKVAEMRVEGIAGGEMVRVEATGDLRIIGVHIDPSLLETGDREMLEELVSSATNQALQKAKEAAANAMQEVAGGMDIPGLSDAMSKFGLGG